MSQKKPAVQKVAFADIMQDDMVRIRAGAFLVVQADDQRNVMTIGWASLGILWARPMLTVMVRASRFTYGIIERCSEFVVSVPTGDMKKELSVCGSRSGRDSNKFEQCNLELAPGLQSRTPIINTAGIHFESAIVYKTAMTPVNLKESYAHLYPTQDYHTLYFGDILEVYRTIGRR
ncbi:MAG: flavin reductase family protein [Chitinivibrionales bacterium]|nr:flavin reductase family protein [Chitinivibrionales bacterium]